VLGTPEHQSPHHSTIGYLSKRWS